MKLSCTRDNLHQGLSITSHLMTKNVNLPILQNVLVKAEGGSIKFTSTNLEIAVNCTVRGKVDESGEYTIPSKLFFDYVSLLPNETIHLDLNEQDVLVNCGTHQTKIHGLSASEFPLVPKVEGEKIFQISAQEFRNALSQVLFSVAINESRPELTGVLLSFKKGNGEGRLIMASTDSYRLSEKTIPIVNNIDEDYLTVVPARTLSEISRILSIFKDDVDLPSNISLHLSSNQLVFVYGSVELISRIIEENYPDYTQIIPKEFQTKAIIDREDFIKAVKTASLFSRLGLFDITLELDPNSAQLSVKSVDATRGENQTNCACEITGQQNSVTVNYKYLLDGLAAMNSDQVQFEMIDASNPCLVTPKDAKDAYKYVLMPIKQ